MNSYGPRIVTDGLICCLDAADLNSYPGTGITITDLSGNGNNAILYNSPVINNGIVTLSSTNDYLEIPKVLQVGTVDFWFNTPDRNNAPIIYAGSSQYNSGAWQWSLFYYANALYCRANAGGGGIDLTSNINLDTWYNFCLTRGSGSSIYINGEYINEAYTPITVTGYTRVGRSGTNYWNGSFGSLRLYSQELSSDQIRQNFEATKGRFGL
jgi:hypothetical protein